MERFVRITIDVTSLFLIVLLLASAGCSSDGDGREPYRNANHNSTGAGQTPALYRATSGGEIVAFVQAINQHEINAAQAAQRKNLGAAVTDYARMLERDHTANKQQTADLARRLNITPKETDGVQQFKRKGANMLASMDSQTGAQFANSFLASMIKGHTEALAMLDTYISAAGNDELRQHLQRTRATIADHLKQANQLQADRAR